MLHLVFVIICVIVGLNVFRWICGCVAEHLQSKIDEQRKGG